MVHIEELTSEVTVFDGELPLTPAQLDRLVRLVAACIAEKNREAEKRREATELRRHATASFEPGS